MNVRRWQLIADDTRLVGKWPHRPTQPELQMALDEAVTLGCSDRDMDLYCDDVWVRYVGAESCAHDIYETIDRDKRIHKCDRCGETFTDPCRILVYINTR